MSDGFTGFPPEAFRFFTDLAKHNNRDWFQAHKDVYEQACREPYKNHLAAGVRGTYVSLSAQGLYVGGGIYRPEPAVLRQLREAIAAEASGKALGRVAKAMKDIEPFNHWFRKHVAGGQGGR